MGRPKKKRKRVVGEVVTTVNKLSRKFVSVKCSKCGNEGHNRRSCKGQSNNQDQAKNKGKGKEKVGGKNKGKGKEKDVGKK